MSPSIYARASDNILLNAAVSVSGFAVLATYDIDTLLTMDSAKRVRLDGDTGEIIFDLGSPGVAGALLCIPVHNFTAGSPSPLTLTNDNGFSASIPIPEPMVDGNCQPILVDLATLDSGSLIGGTWTLVVTSNGANLVLGGAVGIYAPKRSFLDLSANSDGAPVGAFSESYQPRNISTPNEYGSRYVQEYGSVARSLSWNLIGPNSGIVLARDWFLANRGSARPSPLWPYPDEPDLGLYGPIYGTWQDQLRIEALTKDVSSLTAVFDEWPKGEVIA